MESKELSLQAASSVSYTILSVHVQSITKYKFGLNIVCVFPSGFGFLFRFDKPV